MNVIAATSSEIVSQFGSERGYDPAMLHVLPNQARYQPNIYTFQKTYEGTWSVDVFFDSAEAAVKLDSLSLSSTSPAC